ncbi:MAG: hypothetical protein AAB793_00565 [Patescibacteria group bacterium]
MISQKRLLLAVLMIIIAVSLAGWGVWLWNIKTQPNGNANNINMANANISNVNTVSNVNNQPIDTSDWQTYRNEEMGFEVKYPEGWRVEEGGIGNNIINFFPPNKSSGYEYSGDIHIVILENSKNLSLEKYYGEGEMIRANLFVATRENYPINISGIPARRFNGFPTMVQGDESNTVSIPLNDKIIEVVDNYGWHNTDGIFNALVLSFRLK